LNVPNTATYDPKYIATNENAVPVEMLKSAVRKLLKEE